MNIYQLRINSWVLNYVLRVNFESYQLLSGSKAYENSHPGVYSSSGATFIFIVIINSASTHGRTHARKTHIEVGHYRDSIVGCGSVHCSLYIWTKTGLFRHFHATWILLIPYYTTQLSGPDLDSLGHKEMTKNKDKLNYKLYRKVDAFLWQMLQKDLAVWII